MSSSLLNAIAEALRQPSARISEHFDASVGRPKEFTAHPDTDRPLQINERRHGLIKRPDRHVWPSHPVT
jgi:hypothetical protein